MTTNKLIFAILIIGLLGNFPEKLFAQLSISYSKVQQQDTIKISKYCNLPLYLKINNENPGHNFHYTYYLFLKDRYGNVISDDLWLGLVDLKFIKDYIPIHFPAYLFIKNPVLFPSASSIPDGSYEIYVEFSFRPNNSDTTIFKQQSNILQLDVVCHGDVEESDFFELNYGSPSSFISMESRDQLIALERIKAFSEKYPNSRYKDIIMVEILSLTKIYKGKFIEYSDKILFNFSHSQISPFFFILLIPDILFIHYWRIKSTNY